MVSVLLEKSNKSIEVAELLDKQKYYATSIHCSYYSCFQVMLHIKFEKFNEKPESIFQRCKDSDTGSHAVVTNEIKKAVIAKKGFEVAQPLFEKILTLKRNRVIADYYDAHVDLAKSSASLSLAKTVRGTLLNYFK